MLEPCAGAVLVLLVANVVTSWLKRCARAGMFWTWAFLTASQVCLALLHPAMDRMLDEATFGIVDEPRFYQLHRIYLIVTTAQLVAAAAHLWEVLAAWKEEGHRDTGRAE